MKKPFKKKQYFTVGGADGAPGPESGARAEASPEPAGADADSDAASSGQARTGIAAGADESDAEDAGQARSDRRRGIALMILLIAVMLAILIGIGVQLMKVAGDAEALETYIEGLGAWGVLVYMLLVILQILAAVVPGGPFEIAGGYLYGPLKGAFICDIAMTIGSVAVFLLSRKIGMRFVRMFFSEEDISSVRWLQMSDKKTLLLFLIFLIPGTPKDLISYVAGLTDLPLRTWVFITAVGRFPAILFSTISGAALENQNYGMFIAVIVILCVCTAVGALIYRRKMHDE